jgi:hypothetical protein
MYFSDNGKYIDLPTRVSLFSGSRVVVAKKKEKKNRKKDVFKCLIIVGFSP